MKRLLTTIAICLASFNIYAQDIQTYYYNKEGKSVNQVFADYYRVISVPSESNPDRLFRDFYNSGEIKGEGKYISIDPTNANNSIFDGECVFYKEDGSIEKKFTMKDGKLHGIYVEFTSNGNELIQIEYDNGEYAYDWYYKANTSGAYGRFKHNTHEAIYDDFNPDAHFTTWIDEIPWLSYTVNGLTISMAIQESREYGRYHEVSLMIDNATFNTMVIEPSIEVTAYAADYATSLSDPTDSRLVLSYDAYMQKVKNRQTWTAVALAVSSAAAGVSSAMAPNSASISVNGHTAFINSYGNHVSIFAPDLAFAGVGEAWASDRKIIQKGYLKKNTVSSGEIISGYFNIKSEYEKYLIVYYNFNGVQIPFYWDVSETTAKPLDYQKTVKKGESNKPAVKVLKQYESDYLRWQAKHSISLDRVKVKKQTKIKFVDWGQEMQNHKYIIVDINGEHEIKEAYYNEYWVTFYLDTVDLQYPFSIICTDDNDFSFLKVEKL